MALVGGEKLDSHNLRDILRIKDDDRHSNINQSTSSSGGGRRRHNPPGLTLHAIFSAKRSPSPPRPADEPPMQRIESNRTLLDIIREDQTSGLGGDQRDGRRSWKQLKEKIRLRTIGGGLAWFSTVSIPASDVTISNNNHYNHRTTAMTSRHSTRLNPDIDSTESTHLDSSSGPETDIASGRFERAINEDNHRRREDTEEVQRGGDGDSVGGEDGAVVQPVRMSLMALLAESDRQMGLEGSTFAMGKNDEDVAKESVSIGEYNSCCVCMLRHKGAAFIPCGHTFCRLCSRELWAQRGNCPLCNNHILEILDIF